MHWISRLVSRNAPKKLAWSLFFLCLVTLVRYPNIIGLGITPRSEIPSRGEQATIPNAATTKITTDEQPPTDISATPAATIPNRTTKFIPIGKQPHLIPTEDKATEAEDLEIAMKKMQSECEAYTDPAVTSNLSLCPCFPANLNGRNKVDMQTVLTYSWSQVDQELRDLGIQHGGVWKPSSCQARTRAIVVVPFRDRFVHLKAFLIHTHPILQRQMLDYRIVVVEQHLPPVFNKAAVMNAAFLEMKSRGWAADCVVFHDVDLLMEDDRHIVCHGVNATRRTFHHYGAYLSKWNYTRCCGVTIGGGFAVHPSHFEEVNGFTNYIFGWGGEDDDFYYRVLRHHYKMIRPSRILAKYATIPHVSDRRNPKMRASKSKNAPERDGVDSLQYTLSRYAETEYYTWLLIDLNATDLMYEYPTPIYGQLPGKCELSPTWVSVDVNDDDSCRRECEERGPCTAYHFEKRNEMKVEDGRCSLKSDWPPCGIDSLLIAQGKSNEIDSSYIKGVDLKLQEMAVLYSAYEADCHKHDTSRLSSSPLRCSQTCATDDRCGAFSYVPGHPGTCWFKSKCSKLVPSSTTKSYVKRSFL